MVENELRVDATVEMSVEGADDTAEAFLNGFTTAYRLEEGGDADETCEDCGCALSNNSVATKTAEFSTDQTFSAEIRSLIEQKTALTVDDRICEITICPERTTVEYERG